MIRVGLCGVFLAFSLWIGGGPAVAKPILVDRIVATVDGFPITLFELERSMRLSGSQNTEKARSEALEVLIADTLVRLESNRLGLAVSQQEVDMYIEEIKRANGLDDEVLTQALAQQGYTPKTYRNQVRKELLKNQLVARLIRDQVEIPQSQVQKFYDDNKSEFAKAGSVHLRQLFFALPPDASEGQQRQVATVAERAMAELQQGKSFPEVAKKYSEGPEAADGGALGWMEKGQMIPELEQAAFSLRPGEVAPPLRSAAGVHILSVDKMRASEYVPFSDVQQQIRERLMGDVVSEKFQSYVETDLVEGHAIVRRLSLKPKTPSSKNDSSQSDADAQETSDSRNNAG